MANISWFIKTEDKYARAEEELLSIDDKSLTFTRDGIKYQLLSEYSLRPFLHGDVLLMRQETGGKLLPFPIPETISQLDVNVIAGGDKAGFQPGAFKELIAQRTEKLKKRLSDYQELIRFLVKQNAEKDLKSLDFIKDLQGFQDTFYGEFLKIIEQNIENIAKAKSTLQATLPLNALPPTTSQKNGVSPPPPPAVPVATVPPALPNQSSNSPALATTPAPQNYLIQTQPPVTTQPPVQTQSTTQPNSPDTTARMFPLSTAPVSTNIKEKIRSLFQ